MLMSVKSIMYIISIYYHYTYYTYLKYALIGYMYFFRNIFEEFITFL